MLQYFFQMLQHEGGGSRRGGKSKGKGKGGKGKGKGGKSRSRQGSGDAAAEGTSITNFGLKADLRRAGARGRRDSQHSNKPKTMEMLASEHGKIDDLIKSLKPAHERLIGIVKYWKHEKGFGFLNVSSLGRDVFAHNSNLIMESDDMFRSLVPDLTVEFDLEFNEQRQKEMAVNICLPGPGGTQHPITRQALSLDESEWFENGDINPRSCGKQWKVQKDEEEYDFEMKPYKIWTFDFVPDGATNGASSSKAATPTDGAAAAAAAADTNPNPPQGDQESPPTETTQTEGQTETQDDENPSKRRRTVDESSTPPEYAIIS